MLGQALDLWQGDAYAGTSSPALQAEATRLAELRTVAVERRWRLRIDQGRHAEAVAELEQLVAVHPLREQLWGLLALALYRSSRQGDALAALRRARDHLADELGVDPGPELRALEQAVLRQDPSLDAPHGDVGTTPGRRRRPPDARAGRRATRRRRPRSSAATTSWRRVSRRSPTLVPDAVGSCW